MDSSGALKPAFRKQVSAFRKKLPISTISTGICSRIQNLTSFQDARTILSYYPLAAEVDLLPLMTDYPDKQWFLPRIDESNQLDFHRYQSGDPLEAHRYGMKEPLPSAPSVSLDLVDCVFVPGLLFDERGYRLGYGKGYYDRFLPSLPSGSLRIGVCPDMLTLPMTPAEPWDIPVHVVVTEKRTLWIEPRP